MNSRSDVYFAGDHEFATPAAPDTYIEPPSQRMTNADFRKLMMTPKAGSGATTSLLSTPALGSGHLPFAPPRYYFHNHRRLNVRANIHKIAYRLPRIINLVGAPTQEQS
jgi:hypothetical protein